MKIPIFTIKHQKTAITGTGMHGLVVLVCRALTEIFLPDYITTLLVLCLSLYSEAVFSVFKVSMLLADKIKIISDKGITVLLC